MQQQQQWSIINDEDVRFAEESFLQSLEAKECTTSADKVSAYKHGILLHSRALGDKFYLVSYPNFNANVSVDVLCERFEHTGHTLAFAYQYCYGRTFALDLDCIACHSNNSCSQQKMPQQQLTKLLLLIKSNIHDFLKIPTESIVLQSYSNKCGVHIYSNISVSIPTHLLLANLLKPKIFMHTVEVPQFMPLPYSAKQTGQVYLPNNVNVSLGSFVASKYSDNMMYKRSSAMTPMQQQQQQQTFEICIHMMDIFNDMFDGVFCNSPCLIPIDKIPKHFKNIKGYTCSVYPTDLKQITQYLQQLVDDNNREAEESNKQKSVSWDCAKIGISYQAALRIKQFFEEFNNKFYGVPLSKQQTMMINDDNDDYASSESSSDDDDDDVALNNSEDESRSNTKKQRRQLMDTNSGIVENINTEYFVKTSYELNGAMYLQHYVVMFYKYIYNEIKDFSLFKEIIKIVYADLLKKEEEKKKNCSVIWCFCECFDTNIPICYPDSAQQMFDHLLNLFSLRISANHSLKDIVNIFMERKLDTSASVFCQEIDRMKPAEKKKATIRAIVAYCESVIELELITRNPATNSVYSTINGNCMEFENNINLLNLPEVLTKWCPDYRTDEVIVKLGRLMNAKQFRDPSVPKPYLISTQFGVFNSISGLFSAKTKFLTFNVYRNYTLVPMEYIKDSKFIDLEKINKKVLKLQARYSYYAKFLTQNASRVYSHAILIPALLNINEMPFFDDSCAPKLITILQSHDDLSDAYPIINFFNLQPKFVYAIMYIVKKTGTYETFSSYENLCRHTFHYTDVDTNGWRKFIENDLQAGIDGIKQKSDLFLTLLDIDDGDLISLNNPDFVLLTSILAIMLMKMRNFRKFTDAFDLPQLVISSIAAPPTTITAPPTSFSSVLQQQQQQHDTPVVMDDAYAAAVEETLHSEEREWILEYQKTKTLILKKYSNFKIGATIQEFRQNFDRAMNVFFKKSAIESDRNIIQMIFILFSSSDFNQETVCNMISMISTLYLTVNTHKLLFILFGDGHVGKSFICNILTEMCLPFTFRAENISDAVSRANITSNTNITILNEARSIDPDQLKMVTGSDPNSGKIFHKQKYELRLHQSLMFGATNGILTFKNRDPDDRVVIKRVHAVTLRGKQMKDSKNSMSFYMLVTHTYIANIFIMSLKDKACAMNWLAYMYYRETKNPITHEPYINTESPDALAYQHHVFRRNNNVYNFLHQNGIVERQGFSIDSSTLIELISQNFRHQNALLQSGASSSNSSKLVISGKNVIDNITTFKTQFEQTFCPLSGIVEGFQQIGFIEHVEKQMSAMEATNENEIITLQDLDDRVSVYMSDIEKDNARRYFDSMYNIYYVRANDYYKGIKFAENYDSFYVDALRKQQQQQQHHPQTSMPFNSIANSNSSGFNSAPNSIAYTPNNSFIFDPTSSKAFLDGASLLQQKK